MRKYQSHKVVEAVEIREFFELADIPLGADGAHPFKGPIVCTEAEGCIELPADISARYVPQPGDFLIKYPDGYLSVSPRDQFVAGYEALVDRSEQLQKQVDALLGCTDTDLDTIAGIGEALVSMARGH